MISFCRSRALNKTDPTTRESERQSAAHATSERLTATDVLLGVDGLAIPPLISMTLETKMPSTAIKKNSPATDTDTHRRASKRKLCGSRIINAGATTRT